MLSIAQENNLAETAFVKARPDGDWDLRWFTPVHEVDFCGHATLATAHVLLTETKAEAPSSSIRASALCAFPETRTAIVWMFPACRRNRCPRFRQRSRGFSTSPPVHFFRNFENHLRRPRLCGGGAMLRSRPCGNRPPWDCRPGRDGARREGGRADFVSRYFAPGAGIPRGTRSRDRSTRHWCPIGPSDWDATVPLAYQASARGGWLACELAGDRVFLVGNAVTFMKADIFLPDDTAYLLPLFLLLPLPLPPSFPKLFPLSKPSFPDPFPLPLISFPSPPLLLTSSPLLTPPPFHPSLLPSPIYPYPIITLLIPPLYYQNNTLYIPKPGLASSAASIRTDRPYFRSVPPVSGCPPLF